MSAEAEAQLVRRYNPAPAPDLEEEPMEVAIAKGRRARRAPSASTEPLWLPWPRQAAVLARRTLNEISRRSLQMLVQARSSSILGVRKLPWLLERPPTERSPP